MKKGLYEVCVDIILESSEEEIDEIIREQGQDPKEILKRGKEAIDEALARFRKEIKMENVKMLDIIKGTTAKFSCYRQGHLYYEVIKDGKPTWMFPVNIEDKRDIGYATFSAEHKAITLMRYIRKSLERGELVRLN